jgi:hypothetical protein
LPANDANAPFGMRTASVGVCSKESGIESNRICTERLCAQRTAQRTAEGIAQGTAQGIAQGTAQGTMTFSAAEVCVYCVSPQNGHFAVLA